jgi:hypothetical protein
MLLICDPLFDQAWNACSPALNYEWKDAGRVFFLASGGLCLPVAAILYFRSAER